MPPCPARVVVGAYDTSRSRRTCLRSRSWNAAFWGVACPFVHRQTKETSEPKSDVSCVPVSMSASVCLCLCLLLCRVCAHVLQQKQQHLSGRVESLRGGKSRSNSAPAPRLPVRLFLSLSGKPEKAIRELAPQSRKEIGHRRSRDARMERCCDGDSQANWEWGGLLQGVWGGGGGRSHD